MVDEQGHMTNAMRGQMKWDLNLRVFGLIILCVVTLLSAEAQAKNDTVFTIAKFPVEAKAENAVKAKSLALAEGQAAAFRTLLRRLANYSDYGRLPQVEPQQMSKFVDGFSVRTERNSRVRYLATLDFNFHAKEVRSLLRSYNISFIEEQSKTIVVLPIVYSKTATKKNTEQETIVATKFEDTLKKEDKTLQHLWRKAWSSQDLTHVLTPLELAHPNSDITQNRLQDILAGKSEAYNLIKGDYLEQHQKDYFVLAIITRSQDTKKAVVHLIGQDPTGDISNKKSYTLSEESPLETLKEAALFSLKTSESRWKLLRTAKIGDDALSAEPKNFIMTVKFSNLRQWQTIRTKLVEIPGVQQLEVGSLSARGAEISLNYPGGAEYFGRKISYYNMVLEGSDGTWILKMF
ncbi:MAG: DUF2066 domain-containing protein [Pseudomonadota bacterium]